MLPGREPGPPWWEASDQPLELRHGLGDYRSVYKVNVFIQVYINSIFHTDAMLQVSLQNVGIHCHLVKKFPAPTESWDTLLWSDETPTIKLFP
jgi:hypothetical protein